MRSSRTLSVRAGKERGDSLSSDQKSREGGNGRRTGSRRGDGRRDYQRSEAKPRFKNRELNKGREEALYQTQEEHEERIRKGGFSPFQLRLVNSILTTVLCEHKPLDKAYALWFSKVKIPPVEQGFLIRQINNMFRRLSLYAFVSGLKRPSDFERHVGRLVFSYCAEHDWPLPELEGEEGFDRRGLKKRLGEASNNPLMLEGCPVWLEELGKKELGSRWSDIRRQLGGESHRFIRVNTLKCTRDELARTLSEEGVVTRSVKDAPLALEVTSSSALFRTAAFKAGLFEQQDVGSQKIGEFVDAKPGERIIDACAGSGGKTLLLAAAMQGKGTIIALDTEQWKLEDLKKRARRAGAFNIEPKTIDSTKVIKRLYEHADKVLIDAPCSGVGVIRRNPDGKWRDGREKLSELVRVQQDILERYAKMAKVGGEVIYSTCSILPCENEKQIETFLNNNAESFELVAQQVIYPSDTTDGFFMTKLRRKA
ncbi:MAG: RsmB/NOP family class I SAM-dependent RNA methyltransferase [Succinivibrio sp.]|nr:RsmB/NOP family class I SAM-dependent RNA methyltransferase [Succinivibrio sp.]